MWYHARMDTTDHTTDHTTAYQAAPLTDDELAALVALLDGDDITGMALLGSYARGEATCYSDVDLVRFAAEMPTAERDTYTLRSATPIRCVSSAVGWSASQPPRLPPSAKKCAIRGALSG